jgi:hypothetical protein
MTSNINQLTINENFPIAGQDNDTQVFRDNFDSIKTNFRYAKEEIEALQNNTEGLVLSALAENKGSDYNNKIIYNAVLQNVLDRRVDAGAVTASPTTIDFENGAYQIFRVGADLSFDFLNFPTNVNPLLTAGVGKLTLEIYGDGSTRTLSFVTSGGTVIKKNAAFPAPFTVSSSTDPVFVEVWQHSSNAIFLNYIGQFS